MTNTEHMPGPWTYTLDARGVCGIHGGDKAKVPVRIGEVRADTQKQAEANARRIVAAVNACDGIPTEELESGSIDIHALLAKRGQIAVIWCIGDVQERRPDLTEDQCWEVLERAKDQHDADNGISWDVLEWHAEMLFGSAPETDAAEEA